MNETTKRIPKLWTCLTRQPDGTWRRDELPMPLREAKRACQFARILGGLTVRLLEATPDEIEAWKEENCL